MLTQEALRKRVHYDTVSGIFIRKTKAYQAPLCSIVTSKDTKGYTRIRIAGKRYLAHRLAWFYMNDEWPPEEIDHINGIRTDNSAANLRLANRFQNKRNTKTYRNNKSGLKGVSWHATSKKWRARILKDGKELNLGVFDTPEAANAAYAVASVKHFGEFARNA